MQSVQVDHSTDLNEYEAAGADMLKEHSTHLEQRRILPLVQRIAPPPGYSPAVLTDTIIVPIRGLKRDAISQAHSRKARMKHTHRVLRSIIYIYDRYLY